MHPETLRKLVKAAVPYLLPLPVFAGFALRDLPWLGYVIGLATLGYLWWRHRLDGLGRDRLVRSLLVAVAFAAAPQSGFGPRAVLASAGLLLIGLINCEPLLVKALATKRMETANLEVVRPPAARMFEPRWPYLAHTVLLVGFGVVAGFWLPGWPLLPALAAAIGLGLWTLGYAWRQRRSAHDHKRDEAVWQALLHHQPRFAIHFSAPAGTEYHAWSGSACRT